MAPLLIGHRRAKGRNHELYRKLKLIIDFSSECGRIISDHATPFGRRIRSAFATHVLLLEYALSVASVLLLPLLHVLPHHALCYFLRPNYDR